MSNKVEGSHEPKADEQCSRQLKQQRSEEVKSDEVFRTALEKEEQNPNGNPAASNDETYNQSTTHLDDLGQQPSAECMKFETDKYSGIQLKNLELEPSMDGNKHRTNNQFPKQLECLEQPQATYEVNTDANKIEADNQWNMQLDELQQEQVNTDANKIEADNPWNMQLDELQQEPVDNSRTDRQSFKRVEMVEQIALENNMDDAISTKDNKSNMQLYILDQLPSAEASRNDDKNGTAFHSCMQLHPELSSNCCKDVVQSSTLIQCGRSQDIDRSSTLSQCDLSQDVDKSSTLSKRDMSQDVDQSSTLSQRDMLQDVDQSSTLSQRYMSQDVDQSSTLSQRDTSQDVEHSSTLSQRDMSQDVDQSSTLSQRDVSQDIDQSSTMSQLDISHDVDQPGTLSQCNISQVIDQSSTLSQCDRVQEVNIDPWCDLCYEETCQKIQADGFCLECNSFICKLCLKAHKKSPASRTHRLLQGVRMPKCQTDRPIKYPDCYIHIGNVKSKFCFHHSEMICSDCVRETHHRCKIASIHDVCKSLGTTDAKQFMDRINNVLKSTNSTKAMIEENITGIENQKKEMFQSIKKLQDALSAKTEELCSAMIKDIDKVCHEKISSMSDKVMSLSDLIGSFNDIISIIKNLITENFDPNLFIRIQDIVENTRRYKLEIGELENNLHRLEVSVMPNPAVLTFLSECKCIADIKESTTQLDLNPILDITFPETLESDVSQSLKPDESQSTESKVSSLSADEGNKQSIRTESNTEEIGHLKRAALNPTLDEDEKPCKIGGIDITSNGTILLTDYTNRTVKAFSPDNQLLSSLSFVEVPSDITVINDTTAAVSSHTELYILDISDLSSISVQRSVPLGYWIKAMTLCNDFLVVLKLSEPKCVKMIDLYGHELWSKATDHSGQDLFDKPFSLTVTMINDRTTILVTDWSKDTITLFDANNGDYIRTVDVKGKGPHGIIVDSDGNTYVSCFRKKELSVWSADFQQSRTVLTSKDLKLNPLYLVYNDNLNELYVSYKTTDKIDRIILNKLPYLL